jgi:hypothetical protein
MTTIKVHFGKQRLGFPRHKKFQSNLSLVMNEPKQNPKSEKPPIDEKNIPYMERHTIGPTKFSPDSKL